MVDREYNNGDQVCTIWSIQSATYSLGLSLMNFQNLNRGLIWAGSILKAINHVPDINLDDDQSIKINKIEGNIMFNNVTFKYKDRCQNALDGVSIEFAKGKVTALVGPSGSGKTTVAKLLERFYDPQSGSILVGGIDLKCINLRDYRRRIGYVGQEPCLFNESIKNNLLNANPLATDGDIIEWLKISMAYDFVMKLPDGIESDVGALGSKLSGGQKQRIAIARALIRKPDLLILDEATSALDNRNEKYVQKAIENIKNVTNISTVVIAHRLTTIKDADLIVVLDCGKIVESGNHGELLKQNGHYCTLYNSQNVSLKLNENWPISNFSYNQIDNNNSERSSNTLLSIEDIESGPYIKKQIIKDRNWYQTSWKIISYNKPYSFIVIAIIGTTLWSIAITNKINY